LRRRFLYVEHSLGTGAHWAVSQPKDAGTTSNADG
jgi:hypothetical protein